MFFKLRHKPTGLFYKPSKSASPANLSSRGKVYDRYPTLKHLAADYKHPLLGDIYPGWEWRKVRPEEWEVVKFEMREVA